MRTNNLFEREYLKLITQQAEIPQSTCKECRKHFLNVEPETLCPSCKKVNTIPYDATNEDTSEDFEISAEKATDENTEASDTIEECGGKDFSEIEECGDKDFSEIEECDGKNCSDDTSILEEDDFKLNSECNSNDTDIFSEEDNTTNILDNDNFVEEDDKADDQAAESDEEDEDVEETNEEDDAAADEASVSDSKIVSFTSADPAVLEVFEKVQAGELKLVAVPLDFEFAEEDKNQNPDLTIDVLQNFDIEDVSEATEDTEAVEGTEDTEAAEGAENAEENEVNPQDDEVKAEEKNQQLAKESKSFKRAKYVINQPLVQGKRPAGPKKYGPY